MSEMSCDTVVIGAGTSGLEAFQSAVANGSDCVIVEDGREREARTLGAGVSLKLLLEAAHIVRSQGDLSFYGIKLGTPSVPDTAELFAALHNIRERALRQVISLNRNIPDSRRLWGQAHFIDDHHLLVNERLRLTFKSAVIASGATPYVPYELARVSGVITSDELFELRHLPASMAIFGSGALGVQLGQALSLLGCKTSVFGGDKLWYLSDPSVISEACTLLNRNFELNLGTRLTSLEKFDDGYEVYSLNRDQHEHYYKVDRIFSANGRLPDLSTLNPEAAGVRVLPPGRIAVDFATLATSVPHIFAVGDAVRHRMTALNARRDGRIAGRNAARYPDVERTTAAVNLNILFSDPAMAVVGLSLEEMEERSRNGMPFVASEVRFDHGRYLTRPRPGGIIRMYTDFSSHNIVGAELCAPEGEHLAQFLALCIDRRIAVEDLARFMFYNPTFENALTEVAQEAVRQLAHSGATYFYNHAL